MSGDDWYLILALAYDLDRNPENPVCRQWYRMSGRSAFNMPEGDKLDDLLAALSKQYDLSLSPADLLPDWLPLPEDGPGFIRMMQMRPPLWLRAQIKPQRLQQMLKDDGLYAQISDKLPGALKVKEAKVNLYSLPAFQDGAFEVQDFASQVIGYSCAPKPGERWWDACAGAGGKSLQLGSLMAGKGVLIATDIRAYKLKDLKKRARRAGLSNIQSKGWNGTKIPVNKTLFDGVLVDAPCSCTGTWRRNPDARWTTFPEDILATCSTGVRKGGVLVYATCSLMPEENEQQVQAFLESHPEFSLEPFTDPLTGKANSGMQSIRPQDADCDAMFTARMRRS